MEVEGLSVKRGEGDVGAVVQITSLGGVQGLEGAEGGA